MVGLGKIASAKEIVGHAINSHTRSQPSITRSGINYPVPIEPEQTGWLKPSLVAKNSRKFPVNYTRRIFVAGFR